MASSHPVLRRARPDRVRPDALRHWRMMIMQVPIGKSPLLSARLPTIGVMAGLAGFSLWTAAEAQTLDRIRAASAIKLGYEVDARPFSFKNESGTAEGYAV